MSLEIAQSLTLTVNGKPVPLSNATDWASGFNFNATIPPAAIDADPNSTTIVFHTNKVISPRSMGQSSDERTLGVAMDWLHIDPIGN